MREREAQQWSATSHFLHFESPHIARFFSTLFAAHLLCIARAIGAEPGARIYYYMFSFLNNNSFGISVKKSCGRSAIAGLIHIVFFVDIAEQQSHRQLSVLFKLFFYSAVVGGGVII